MDNATMAEAFERRCREKVVPGCPDEMHAVHNPFVCFEDMMCSVIFRGSNILTQLLEAIGVLTKEETKKFKSRDTVYRDAATESLSDKCENEAAQMDDPSHRNIIHFRLRQPRLVLCYVDAYVVDGMITPFILGNDSADQYSSFIIREEGSTYLQFGKSGCRLPVQNSTSPSLVDESGHVSVKRNAIAMSSVRSESLFQRKPTNWSKSALIFQRIANSSLSGDF
jgi:hypothetical protein